MQFLKELQQKDSFAFALLVPCIFCMPLLLLFVNYTRQRKAHLRITTRKMTECHGENHGARVRRCENPRVVVVRSTLVQL